LLPAVDAIVVPDYFSPLLSTVGRGSVRAFERTRPRAIWSPDDIFHAASLLLWSPVSHRRRATARTPAGPTRQAD
jgi:hypothetical protein